MKPIDILKAMNGVRAEYVLDAQQALNNAEEKAGKQSVRKLGRVILMAAVITALLAATAYAAGLLGIQDRGFPVPALKDTGPNMEAEETGETLHLSLNGYRESPEYQASAEWVAFYWDYVRHNDISNDSPHLEGASEDYVNICHYYGCHDKTMADKLFEIAEKYGLYLVSDMTSASSMEEFIRAAGTGDFLTEGRSNGGYIYEDGTFSLAADVGVPGEEQRIGFCMIRTVAGTLPPMSLGLNERFTEWEYTNAQGDTVRIGLGQEGGRIVILYEEDGVFLTVNVSMGKEEGSATDAEHLADAIRFHEAAKTEKEADKK